MGSGNTWLKGFVFTMKRGRKRRAFKTEALVVVDRCGAAMVGTGYPPKRDDGDWDNASPAVRRLGDPPFLAPCENHDRDSLACALSPCSVAPWKLGLP